MRYSCMINDYSSLNITKLDVLDKMKEIEVVVEYQDKNGVALK
jgi:adenylosuccinate synthase